MRPVTESEVVWQYLRWHSEYRDSSHLPIIIAPDLNEPSQNDARWRLLARNEGHVQRVRYSFQGSPVAYQWSARRVARDGFRAVSSNYSIGSRLLSISEMAMRYVSHGDLPGFDAGFCRIVEENVRRLIDDAEAPPDFNGIILCRPHPILPAQTYRVVEGTKRAIAVQVACLRDLRVPTLHSYFGDHITS